MSGPYVMVLTDRPGAFAEVIGGLLTVAKARGSIPTLHYNLAERDFWETNPPRWARTLTAEALLKLRALRWSAPFYKFVVVTSAAGNTRQGRYRRVAVLRVLIGLSDPKKIANGFGVEIIRTWERLHGGSTDACAYAKALKEAEALKEAFAAQKNLEAAQ